MAELLLELLSEEIPARMQKRAADDLARLLTDGLKKAGVEPDSVETFAGPRRLTAVIEALPDATPDVSEERKGPRVGAPDKAIEGFLRGAGLDSIDRAETREDKKGAYYVATIQTPGRPVPDVLAELIPAICADFPWPKSMRWADRSERWVRPLRRILCLFGGEVVPFSFAGVESGDQTEGHRIHGPGPFAVRNFAEYKQVLEGKGFVLLEAEARAARIAAAIAKICADNDLKLVPDDALLAENAGLAEWPTPLLGSFDRAYLDLPPEVIQLTMAKNQKYFAVTEAHNETLAPNFICVADLEAPDGGKAIAEGNGRVLSARLDDARFFWEQDKATKLADRVDDLNGVVFHRKLGTLHDKAQRVSALARDLAPLCGADADAAERAGLLAKADLTTEMVQEFTDLQGVMGAYYARHDGLSDDIATAIRDHYKPMGPADAVPHDPVAIAVALADKLDTLVGFWAIDEKPTGSKDPYALRRAALGVIRIVLTNNVRMGLLSLFDGLDYGIFKQELEQEERDAAKAAGQFMDEYRGLKVTRRPPGKVPHLKFDDLPEHSPRSVDLLTFFADRLKVALREDGVRHDLIDAVFALGEDDLVAIAKRVDALQHFCETDEGENLLAGAKRAMNIVEAEEKKGFAADDSEFDEALLKENEEKALAAALDVARAAAADAVEREDYEAAMAAIAPLRPAIDAFFDNVTVNVEGDENLRRNRLLLLRRIRDALGQVADFSRIAGG